MFITHHNVFLTLNKPNVCGFKPGQGDKNLQHTLNSAQYDRGTMPAKFTDISCQLTALVLDVSAATIEHWCVTQE
jgi:hypothetical protein